MIDNTTTALVPVHPNCTVEVTDVEFDSSFETGKFLVPGHCTVEITEITDVQLFARIVQAVRLAVEGSR